MQNSKQVADYIGDMCRELAELANKSELHKLQNLLTNARREAYQVMGKDSEHHVRQPQPDSKAIKRNGARENGVASIEA